MNTKPKVVVLGAHGCGGNRVRVHRVPVPGETTIAWDFQIHKDGGKGAHQAMVIGRLGGSSAFIGKVGSGPDGDTSAQWLVDDNVNIKHLLRYHHKKQTRPGLILVDDEGVSTIISIRDNEFTLTFDEVKHCIEDFSSAEIFITGFEIPVETALEGARLAKKLGMMTILNPAPMPREPLGMLDFIDIVIPNEPETKAMAGVSLEDHIEPVKLASLIKEKYKINTVIITMGGDGVFGYDGYNSWMIPPIKVDVVNTTGAGDAFIGGFTWALSNGEGIYESIKWGNYVAAFSVTREGTIDSFPTLDELKSFIKNINNA